MTAISYYKEVGKYPRYLKNKKFHSPKETEAARVLLGK